VRVRAGNCGCTEADLVMMLRAAEHQSGAQNVAGAAELTSTPTGQAPTVARLQRSVAHPCKPESV